MADTQHAARSRLRLRPPPVVALGFCLGPAAGLSALWALMLVFTILDPRRSASPTQVLEFTFFWVYLLIFGGAVCLVVELLVVTPLLIGFRRHGWRWLNGWTGALIGFALAFVPALVVVALLPGPPDQTVWGMPTVVAGRHTAAGWAWALVGCAMVGMVGLVAAGVFRLIAVEPAEPPGAAS
jgi:hypothetical protein